MELSGMLKVWQLLKIVATGLINLTELFKSQNVTVESLLVIGNNDKKNIKN